MNATFKLLITLFAALVLAACSSTGTQDDPSSSTEGEVIEDTTAIAVDDTSASDFASDPEEGLDSVFYFDFDDSSLTISTRIALDAYAAVLSNNPRNIRLEGHGDERGTREYNIALGERRANAVAEYLITSGVSSGLIETISYGEERPAVSGSGDSAWSQNRRVELK